MVVVERAYTCEACINTYVEPCLCCDDDSGGYIYDQQNPRCIFYAFNSCGFSLFGANVWFSILAVNAFFSLVAINCFGSFLSINSVLSMGSINSFFSIGCGNSFFKDCYGKGMLGCLESPLQCFAGAAG